MSGSIRSVAVVMTVGLVVVGLTAYALKRGGDLPESYQDVHRDVFPDADYDAAAPGTSIERIYGVFGKAVPQEVTTGKTRQCIYFAYDPNLFEGALVVLGRSGIVEKRWVVKEAAKPEECSGLPEERVDLRGWYAGAVRVRGG